MNPRSAFAQLIFAALVCVFSSWVQAEIYQWKDEAGRTHYSDKQSATAANVHKVASTPNIPASVKLDVPLVKQGKNLCGPATIEMLFRYWGIHDYDQYDIAYNLLLQFAESERVRRSGILQADAIDWNRYPGTGTINMREFLERFSKTENPRLKHLPPDSYLKEKERESRLLQLQKYVAQGIPVIVHQYWGTVGSKGHYRLVTGYNDNRKEIYLNDATEGTEVTQSYESFLALWNVDEPSLHYNAIVFNENKRDVRVRLVPFKGQKPKES
jgi:hypothetical protein